MELTVDVAAYLKSSALSKMVEEDQTRTYRDWGIHGNDIALFNQQLSGLVTELANLRLGNRST